MKKDMQFLKRAFPNNADRYALMVFSFVCGIFFVLFCVLFLPYIFIDELARFDVIYDGQSITLDDRSFESLRKADIHPWSSIWLVVQNETQWDCNATLTTEGKEGEKFNLSPGQSWGFFIERKKIVVTVCGQVETFDFSVLKKSIFE